LHLAIDLITPEAEFASLSQRKVSRLFFSDLIKLSFCFLFHRINMRRKDTKLYSSCAYYVIVQAIRAFSLKKYAACKRVLM